MDKGEEERERRRRLGEEEREEAKLMQLRLNLSKSPIPELTSLSPSPFLSSEIDVSARFFALRELFFSDTEGSNYWVVLCLVH